MQVATDAKEKLTPFKQAQLRHKRKSDNPNRLDDIDDWVDFGIIEKKDNRIVLLSLPEISSQWRCYKGPIYGLKGFPGFIFAPQALSTCLQTEVAFQSVTKYCEAPHKTNIDQCPSKYNTELDNCLSMWEHWKDENKMEDSKSKRQRVSQEAGKRKHRSFQKLSWSTMGYHYDWTKRSYNKSLKSEIPCLIKKLSRIFATTSLLLEGKDKESDLSFCPSASIVNFYTTKSNMGGHRDDLEFAFDKPIVSISVGLPAVFLLGGKSKEDYPVIPILIRSGDVLCMGGDSRLNYHGMARVLPSSVRLPKASLCPADADKLRLADMSLTATELSSEDFQALDNFTSTHRININVRQVYEEENFCDLVNDM